MDTGQTHKVVDLPPYARVTSLNADETLVAGTLIEGESGAAIQMDTDPILRDKPLTEDQMDKRLDARLPMALFTINLQTAALKTLLRSNDWLDEVMFSPTEPGLLMYCHQGSWLKVDRLWTIGVDGTGNNLVHQRTLYREAVGNAFWDADGKTVWYDLQAPLGQNFYLASYNVVTGLRQRYSIERNNWSVHYNAAVDDSAFCGDGSDSIGAATALDGKWLELFYPRKQAEPTDSSLKSLIQTESFKQQHLVNLSKQKYAVEPNARFTPDHRRVIFTSNMFGPSYIFAVEVAHDHTQPATTSTVASQ
jgi:oligogalacturonide lyase